MKAGLYIFKDRKDRIKIDLPVTGKVNSPKFSYWHIAFKTLGNLLVKVALSPMSFIAQQLGIASDGLDKMDIDAQQRDFTTEQYTTLKTLADIIKQKPGLVLQLTQNIDYSEAVQNFALANLKKEYYLQLNPAERAKGLEFIDIATLNQIDTKDKDFIAFTDNLLREKNLSQEGSIKDKVMVFFKTVAEAQVIRVMEARNQKMITYLTSTCGVKPERIKVINTPLTQLLSCKKNQYDITMNDGEEQEPTASK